MTFEDLRAAWKDASPIIYLAAVFIGVFGGTAGLSGLIAATSQPKPAGTDDVVSVGQAFYATWPMALALAIIVIVLAAAGDKLHPVVFVVGVPFLLWVAVAVAQVSAAGTVPVPPPSRSPTEAVRATELAFDEFANLYGENLVGGGIAGVAVGAFCFVFFGNLARKSE